MYTSQFNSKNRLSENVHYLADMAISGEFSRRLQKDFIPLDEYDTEELTPLQLYALSVQKIAEQCPIFVLPQEELVGAATMDAARRGLVPTSLNGEYIFYGLSHLTLDFDHTLPMGYKGLREQITRKKAEPDLSPSQIDLLDSMESCLNSALLWHDRYISLLESKYQETGDTHYLDIISYAKNVPENPPQSFREALQSLLFMFLFQRLCGCWPAIGRFDKMLGHYLQDDLKKNLITLDEARNLIAHFWIRCCDWILGKYNIGQKRNSGDAQTYINIVLGGVYEDGTPVENEVTHLVLEMLEELHISELPVAVRVNDNTSEELLRKIARVQKRGGGIVAIYNDTQIIQSLVDYGYPLEEARDFANDGCWEIQIPGRTNFYYHPIDIYRCVQEALGITEDGSIPNYTSFEELYEAFHRKLNALVNSVHTDDADLFGNDYPCPLLSLLERDCIEKAEGYMNFGTRYTVASPHAGGLPDAANSLYVVKKLVFEEKRATLEELISAVRNNWQGNEPLRQYIRKQYRLFGNDNEEADAMANRVFNDFVDAVDAVHERYGVLRAAGISTFGRQIDWAPHRGASVTGFRDGEFLSPNCSPAPGTDFAGPTAVIKSHCSLDLRRLTNGTALDIKIDPSSVKGEEGEKALVALMRSFVSLGGIFMHIDIVDTDMLRDAQVHPENYLNLSVRVSGWSARFITLDDQWQKMIIDRTEMQV